MKLTKCALENVMSHAKSEIALGDCLTVLTGSSDCGKSVFVRAFDLCLRNHPSGVDLLRHKAPRGAMATIRIDGKDDAGNDVSIVRERNKSNNVYEFNGDKLLAFGTSVPEQIAKLLNLADCAFQLQQDRNFMLSSTDGQNAQLLGRIVGLDDIDKAFAAIRERKSKNDEALRDAKRDMDEAEKTLKLFEGYETLAADIVSIKRLLASQQADTIKLTRESQLSALLGESTRAHDLKLADATQALDKQLDAMFSGEVLREKNKEEYARACSLHLLLSHVLKALALPLDSAMDSVSKIMSRAKILAGKEKADAAAEKSAKEHYCELVPCLAECGVALNLAAEKLQLLKDDVDKAGVVTLLYGKQVKKCNESSAFRDAVSKTEHDIDDTEGKFNEAKRLFDAYVATHDTCPSCGASKLYWGKLEQTDE